MACQRVPERAIGAIILACLTPVSAMAYIGPGAGLSAIGAFLAVVAAIVLALFGFVWYPVRRLIRMLKKSSHSETEEPSE